MGGTMIDTTAFGSRAAEYQGKVTFAVVVISIVAASGGLLFGYDNGIMGGVASNPDYQAYYFPSVLHAPNSTSPFCQYDDHTLSVVTSSLYLSAAFVAIIGGWASNKFGRKIVMVFSGFFFGLGTAIAAASVAVGMMVLGRVVIGFGVGLASSTTPLFISEMAPYKYRGTLNLAFQMAVTIGIFAAQLINYGTQNIHPWSWRISVALGGVPALCMFIGSIILPDTPNSLVNRGKLDEARAVLKMIRGTEDVDVEFEDILVASEMAKTAPNPYMSIIKRRCVPQLIIVIFLPLFQQFTGINAVMFYSPQMFQAAGQNSNDALLNTVIIGSVNVFSTIIAIVLVDRLGRRFLFFQGGAQMIASLAIVGALIKYNTDAPGNVHMAQSIVAFICIYVAGFAWSWGPLAWLVPSEISTLETRSAGMSIATCSNFLFTFLIGQCFLSMLCAMEWGVFIFFLAIVVIMTMFVAACLPETKGVPVEEVDVVLFYNHWLWGRYMAPAGGLPRDNQDAAAVSTVSLEADAK